jgi:hypothetical protein
MTGLRMTGRSGDDSLYKEWIDTVTLSMELTISSVTVS